MKIVSLFSGAGGFDLGFKKAGFNIIWANEFDKSIWNTYESNHSTYLDRRDIRKISSEEIPNCDGIIGGPPCQSWSEAGLKKGINDPRGKLFYDFIRIVKYKKPKFFVVENVAGILSASNRIALNEFIHLFHNSGYNIYFKLLNSKDFSIPQDRKRVFFVGIRNDYKIEYTFPNKKYASRNLKDAIFDLHNLALPAKPHNITNSDSCSIPNHEYMVGSFSSMYMSRNRVRSWDETSFTIQAGGRHAPIHPRAPKMKFIDKNKRIFVPGYEDKYRRLSIRECARIQTFPDDFIFHYNYLSDGYKMVGNAVPVELANIIGKSILKIF